MLTGSCLCGAITLEIEGAHGQPRACHCTQCRKTSGHYWASVDLSKVGLTVHGTPRWYLSSPGVRRGFCGTCGASLFWQEEGTGRISVAAGALDAPTGLRLAEHIFTADKGDYYDIADDAAQS